MENRRGGSFSSPVSVFLIQYGERALSHKNRKSVSEKFKEKSLKNAATIPKDW